MFVLRRKVVCRLSDAQIQRIQDSSGSQLHAHPTGQAAAQSPKPLRSSGANSDTSKTKTWPQEGNSCAALVATAIDDAGKAFVGFQGEK